MGSGSSALAKAEDDADSDDCLSHSMSRSSGRFRAGVGGGVGSVMSRYCRSIAKTSLRMIARPSLVARSCARASTTDGRLHLRFS